MDVPSGFKRHGTPGGSEAQSYVFSCVGVPWAYIITAPRARPSKWYIFTKKNWEIGKKKRDNAANDIFDITKIALKRRRTEKLEAAQRLSQKLAEEEEDQEREKVAEDKYNKENLVKNDKMEQNSPENFTFQEEIMKRPAISNRYNIMNEVTLDEGSTILSGNRSIDVGNSNRPLIEEGTRRRASILKNQYVFGDSSPRKKTQGKKIKFTLDQ